MIEKEISFRTNVHFKIIDIYRVIINKFITENDYNEKKSKFVNNILIKNNIPWNIHNNMVKINDYNKEDNDYVIIINIDREKHVKILIHTIENDSSTPYMKTMSMLECEETVVVSDNNKCVLSCNINIERLYYG